MQRRLAELERSMRDFHLDVDRNQNEMSNELRRLGATVQELDSCSEQTAVSELRAEVAALRQRLDHEGRSVSLPPWSRRGAVLLTRLPRSMAQKVKTSSQAPRFQRPSPLPWVAPARVTSVK